MTLPHKAPVTPRQGLRLHIERVVLQGLPFDRRQVRQFQAALETELARLFAGPGFRGELPTGGAEAASAEADVA